jgi:AraC-like DNA-binding protein
MQVVFDAKPLAPARRRQAWREAICDIYLQVDCAAEDDGDYEGFVREARFGAVTITDTLISPQVVRRLRQHVGRSDKDCYYVGIEHLNAVIIRQCGGSVVARPGFGGLYYANHPYELECNLTSRQSWIELPRQVFDGRFDSGLRPALSQFDLRQGLGRVAADFCASLAAQSAAISGPSRVKLGEQLMDIIALALSGDAERQSADESSVKSARLRSVKAYMEANLGDPNLSLTAVAKKNGISLRYLHQLFRLTDMTASDWLRLRRLQRCYDLLTSPQHAKMSITNIAFSMGFSSSSHFSNLFRAQFNMRASDVRAAAVAA